MLTTSIAISTTNRLVTIRLFKKKLAIFKHININHIGPFSFVTFYQPIFSYTQQKDYTDHIGHFSFADFFYTAHLSIKL